MKLWLTLLILLAAWYQGTVSACAAGITEDAGLNSSAFYLPEGDALLMTPDEIKAYNRRILAKSPSVCDLKTYPLVLPADTMKKLLMPVNPIDTMLYVNGRSMTPQYRQMILREINLDAVAPQTAVQYGIVVRRANLRGLPAKEGWFSTPNDTDFDTLQETAVDPSEPVVILHTSASGKFNYIQMRNYRGWLKSADIARTTRNIWQTFVNMPDFLVVTANRYGIPINNGQALYQMGAKIPLVNASASTYRVSIPQRSADGMLFTDEVSLPKSPSLHHGFLPYTRNQIIAQSFRFLHDPYGWGGLKNSVDCSSFIANIYRTVGIELPRNADEQELTSGTYTSLRNLPMAERKNRLHALHPGDTLFFDGHTMLYLGEANGTPCIIHSLGSHTRHHADGSKEKIPTMRVVVSDLTLQRYSGISFLDALTGAMSFR